MTDFETLAAFLKGRRIVRLDHHDPESEVMLLLDDGSCLMLFADAEGNPGGALHVFASEDADYELLGILEGDGE